MICIIKLRRLQLSEIFAIVWCRFSTPKQQQRQPQDQQATLVPLFSGTQARKDDGPRLHQSGTFILKRIRGFCPYFKELFGNETQKVGMLTDCKYEFKPRLLLIFCRCSCLVFCFGISCLASHVTWANTRRRVRNIFKLNTNQPTTTLRATTTTQIPITQTKWPEYNHGSFSAYFSAHKRICQSAI